MNGAKKEGFGATVRRDREKLEIGLREMARKIGVSPTYLSKVERDQFPPPAEDKVIAIASVLGPPTRTNCWRLPGRCPPI